MIYALSGCGSRQFLVDPAAAASTANDLTALADASELQGCGTQLQAGLLFCRIEEFQSTDSEIRFVGPISNCAREFCVYIRIYFPNGSPSLEIAIPRKQNYVAVSWKQLLGGRSHFLVGDRGFWPFERAVYWRDREGRENITRDDGLIYMRVLRSTVGGKTYSPLHASQNSPHFVYSARWLHGEVFSLTTSGRTYVGKAK
jgi:hypothetical protein